MKPKKKEKRVYTLDQVLDAVQEALAGDASDPEGGELVRLKLRTPSSPTLKNWSAAGFFKAAPTLEIATSLVLDRLKENARYYPDGKKKKPVAADQMDAGVAGQILQEMRKLNARISDIENSSKTNGSSNQPGAAELLKRVLGSIDQLDTTRKQMMVRLDSEMQLVKHGGSGGRAAEGAAAMDIQRVLARISNVEQLLQRLLTPQD